MYIWVNEYGLYSCFTASVFCRLALLLDSSSSVDFASDSCTFGLVSLSLFGFFFITTPLSVFLVSFLGPVLSAAGLARAVDAEADPLAGKGAAETDRAATALSHWSIYC
jgi:hypothetical protein